MSSASPRRRLPAAERRELIVTAALEVFAEEGYAAASVDGICSRAGITKPVLYDHFASKQELYLTLLELQRDESLEHVLSTLGAVGRPAEAVTRAVDAFFAWVQDNRFAWRLLFRDSTGEPDVAERHRQLQSEAHLAVATAVLGGMRGDVDDAASYAVERAGGVVSLEMFASLIGGAMNGLARWWYDHPQVPREQVASAALKVLWTGLERLDGEP